MRRLQQEVEQRSQLAVGPDLPGEISLGVGDGFPMLDEDGVAGDRLDGLAQGLLHRLVRGRARGNVHVRGLHGDDDPVAAVADDLDGMRRARRSRTACRRSSTDAA